MSKIKRQHSDYLLSLLVFGLIAFGLIAIYSVSKYYSLDLTNGATDKLFLKKQLITVCLGLVVWVVFQAIDYRIWLKYAGLCFFLTIFFLVLPLLLEPFGLSRAGRWIDLGFTNFQPAEFGKLTFLIYLCGWFSRQGESMAKIQKMFWPFVAIVGFIAFLMILQKDLGTLSVYIIISATVFIMAGAPFYQVFGGGCLAAFLLWLAIKIEPYRMQRLLTFLNPSDDSLSAGYHIKNALIAIGSGGLWGLGFGQSKQKYLYLPEAHTDSIFAIISEELGLFRASLVIIVFTLFALRGLKIVKNSPDIFARLISSGIIVWIFSQMFVNIAAMFSLVPLTGIPLPFISYGGTSLMVLLAGIGILTNISKFQSLENRRLR
jgi:cell division protein FtsW